ncbi:fatty acyl-CoA synthetase [Nevskia sp.]|uniref:fatty acyl-CoA synthetase n=1 Tax=Nevskia sp. TaxID=1929292 RepID=UPI0025DE892F|nr:fatty acyl-CoA synthetase [Nevskia sp.]
MTPSLPADIVRARRNTLGDALRRSARRHRGRAALSYGDRTWSFEALDQAANRVALYYAGLGVTAGDRVLSYGKNSDAYLIAFLGCTRLGAIHVPINYALTGDELIYLVKQSGAVLVLSDPDLVANLAVLGADQPTTRLLKGEPGHDLLSVALSGPLPDTDFAVDDTSVVQFLYTSGTTAAPKGAMLTHGGIQAEYQTCIQDLELRESDRALAALPLYHTAQMHVFTMPHLLVGAWQMIIDAPAPARVLELIERERITSFFAPPTVWISLLRHPDFATRDLSSLAKVYYGASIMPVPVLQELRARLPKAEPFNCYGQTEIAPMATVLKPHEHEARPASAGRPVFNVETRVVDDDFKDCAPGTLGEIVHRSPQLTIGYWQKPEQTAEAFAGGWFRSGDLGYFDAEGYLFIADRVKDVINTGGVLVASREVEEALLTHASVSEVAVVALPDPKWIEAVAAFVVLRDGAQATAEELIAHSKTTLAPYKVPKQVIFVTNLPRNTAGKILKRELRKAHTGSEQMFATG